jgi:hypothetical protein
VITLFNCTRPVRALKLEERDAHQGRLQAPHVLHSTAGAVELRNETVHEFHTPSQLDVLTIGKHSQQADTSAQVRSLFCNFSVTRAGDTGVGAPLPETKFFVPRLALL